MPSTISTSVSSDLFSSTVMTPSLPTFCIAWAIILPMAVSPLAVMVPTWATSEEAATGLARFAGCAKTFFDHDVAALRTERHLHRVGENVDAAQHAVAGIAGKFNVFGSHLNCSWK